jgi:hypothetical protein
MRTSITRLFTIVLLLCLLPATSESGDVTGGGSVNAGHNSIKWKGRLAGNTNVGVNATFSPAGNKLFVSESAVAASLGTETKWTGNYENTENSATFTTTIKPAEFKKYPTFFTGSFQYPKSQAEKPRHPSVPPQWLASGVLSDDGTHSWFKIDDGTRTVSNENSGVSFNNSKDKSEWERKRLIVNIPITLTSEEVEATLNKDKAIADAAVIQLAEKIEGFVFAEKEKVAQQKGINFDAKKDNVAGFTIGLWSAPDITFDLSTENNCDCPGTPPKDPACKEMVKMTIFVKITASIESTIYLPQWDTSKATAKAKGIWNKIRKGIEEHELIHNSYRIDCANQLRSLEKSTYIIDVCSCEFNYEDFKTEVMKHINKLCKRCWDSIEINDNNLDNKK